LADAQIEALTALLLRIERYYGAPQDVEWCHDDERFWIVQSRPVTTVGTSRVPEPEWTRANLVEVLPDQTSPLVLDAIAETLNLAYRRFMGRLIAPESVLGPMVKASRTAVFQPVATASPVRHERFSGGRVDAGARSRRADSTGGRDHNTHSPGERLRCLPDMVRVGIATLRAPQTFRRHQKRMRRIIARLDEGDLDAGRSGGVGCHRLVEGPGAGSH